MAVDRARQLAEALSELLNCAGYIFLKGEALSLAEAQRLEQLADTVLAGFQGGGVYQEGLDLKRLQESLEVWSAALRHPTGDGIREASKGLLEAMGVPTEQLA